MVNFPELTVPDLTELTGLPDGLARNGFQGAHIHGRAEFTEILQGLFDFMNEGLEAGHADYLTIDHVTNGVLLPSAGRANTHKAAMILGVATHSYKAKN